MSSVQLTLSYFLLIFALPLHAETQVAANTSANLRGLAQKELETAGKSSARASDAQISEASGVLSLQDPGLVVTPSLWSWQLGLKLQTHLPKGSTALTGLPSYQFEQVGSSPLPFLEIGARRELQKNDSWSWGISPRIEAGYANKRTQVSFPTGFNVDQVRFSTTLAAAHLAGYARWVRLPKLEAELGLGQGLISYTQAGGNDSVNFSKQARYAEFGGALSWWFTEQFALTLSQSRRQADSKDDLSLQQDNTSVGTRLLW